MKLLLRVFATLFFAIISPLYVLYLFVSFLLSAAHGMFFPG